jgi:shikimate kinase
MKVFLIGYAGSGKSSLGKRLGWRIEVPYYDLDQLISKSVGRPVGEIIERLGEEFFREKEKEILEKFIHDKKEYLLACGGGTPCFFNNMDAMNKAGVTVYLKADPGLLADRIENSIEERPLLKGKKGEELKKHITKQLMDREKFYEQAQLTLPVPLEDWKTIEKKIKEAVEAKQAV